MNILSIHEQAHVLHANFHNIWFTYAFMQQRQGYVKVFLHITGTHSTKSRAIFSCDQAALWKVQSVRTSVGPSVCPSVTPFSPFRGQRSKVKVTEPQTQFIRFRTVTPVWIDIWWWNVAQRLMLLKGGALSFSMSSTKFQGHTAKKIKVTWDQKNHRFWPKLGVSGL